MAITRKGLLGLDAIISSVKTWCTSTFSTRGHTHTVGQITNLSTSNFPTWTLVYNRSYGTIYTETTDGCLFIYSCDPWNCNDSSVLLNKVTLPIYRGIGNSVGCGSAICIPIAKGTRYRVNKGNVYQVSAWFTPCS